MSPTSDDLRALLAERADSGPVTAPFDASTGARLAGVRARIRQRRRARAAASALAVVLVAGSATAVTARLRHEVREPEPAQGLQLPARDLQGRPLATQVHAQRLATNTAHLAVGWPDLHLALRCTGSGSATAVALLAGRAVAHIRCDGPGGDVTVTSKQARSWGLPVDRGTTVSVMLVRTPSARNQLRLTDGITDDGTRATVGVYTTGRVESGDAFKGQGDPQLGGLSLPVTAGLGTRTLTVVSGGGPISVGSSCGYAAGQSFGLVVTAQGRRDVLRCAGSSADTQVRVVVVRPRAGEVVTIAVQVTALLQGEPGPDVDLDSLGQDLPGASVQVSVTGRAYLPDDVQRSSLLSPPEVDAQGRPLLLSLVAARGRSGYATVRTETAEGLAWQLWCTTDGGALAELSLGADRLAPGCRGEGPEVSQGTSGADGQIDVRLRLADAGPEAGAVLALYGRGTVLRVVQQAAGAAGVTDPAALVTTTPPAPPVDDGVTVDGRRSVLTAVLVVRGGQLLSVGSGAGPRYGFTMACTGTKETVMARVFVDGAVAAGDQGRSRPCEGTVRGGVTTTEDSTGPRRVELGVLGPESAMVTVGVYDVAVDLP